MSIEQNKPSIVTIDDLSDFYKEKNVHDVCPMCGKDLWMPMSANGENEVQYIAPQFITPDGKATRKGPRLATLVCVNCGNVRLQHLGPILDWKRVNGRD